ncbi:MAG: RHS repeat protein, partial [Candidatus Omnitrophota bacterium]
MLTWDDGASSASFTYDALNRVSSVNTNYLFGTKTVSYSYDGVGNRIALNYPDGIGTVNYNYDSLNRLIQINHNTDTATYEYDTSGRLIKKTLPNGVYTDYNYDSLNRLIFMVNKKSDDSVISSFGYTHDNAGNRKTMTTTEGVHDYTYDDIYRLKNATHPGTPAEAYNYDGVGNRLSSADYPSWNYDKNNRLTNYNGTSFTYDNNGNTITKTQGADVTSYAYDYENRLTTVNGTQLTVNVEYCPFGKR